MTLPADISFQMARHEKCHMILSAGKRLKGVFSPCKNKPPEVASQLDLRAITKRKYICEHWGSSAKFIYVRAMSAIASRGMFPIPGPTGIPRVASSPEPNSPRMPDSPHHANALYTTIEVESRSNPS